MAQTVSGYTVSGLVGSDTTSSLSGVSASGASGTSVGSYTNAVTASAQTNYTVTTADGTLTISASSSSSSGSTTTAATVVEPESVPFRMPTRGVAALLIDVEGASTGGAENPADEWREASGARLRPVKMTVDALPDISAIN